MRSVVCPFGSVMGALSGIVFSVAAWRRRSDGWNQRSRDRGHLTYGLLQRRVQPQRLVDDRVEHRQAGHQLVPCRIGGRKLVTEFFPQSVLDLRVPREFDQRPLDAGQVGCQTLRCG
jgi:hypothetical protein